MIDLSDRFALVMGGSGGIGSATAHMLGRAGANVMVAARDESKIASVADEIRSLGVIGIASSCDATDASSLTRLIEDVQRRFGRLDILVNAHGAGLRRPLIDMDEKAFEEIIATNLTSVFAACRAAYPLLQEARGTIINVASMGSFVGLRQASAYTASKGGLAQLTKAIAVEWAQDGIRCNAVAPGWVETPLSAVALADDDYRARILARTPMGRLCSADDVAGAILFLASDLASYVTGTIVVVDGGAMASV